MDSRKRFSALETMCRERAQLAKREFEYWLAEADEWARYKDSSDPSIEAIPTQLDWCVEPLSTIKNSYANLTCLDTHAFAPVASAWLVAPNAFVRSALVAQRWEPLRPETRFAC